MMHKMRNAPVDLRDLSLAVALAVVIAACGQTPSPNPSETAGTEVPGMTADQRSENLSPPAVSVGSVGFAVGGSDKLFDYLPEGECFYTKLASSIWAYPASASTESLAIHFLSLDLRALAFPIDLPIRKDPSNPMSPLAAGNTIGFGYIDAEGVEWAGPGKVRVESFGRDGVIHLTFDQVTLPHTDGERPDVILTDGKCSARITAPW